MSNVSKNLKLFYIESLGCAKNQVDAELISGIMMENGWNITPTAEIANCIIINTCSFLSSSRDEAKQVIEYYCELKTKTNCKLIITGCLPERDNDQILASFPEIDTIVGINGYSKINEYAELPNDSSGKYVPSFTGEYKKENYISRPFSGGYGWAYLKIADGCDNCCTYCAIPGIRGKFHSRQIEDIIDEATNMVRNRNIKEIILIAQDTSNYGVDIDGKQLLPQLLDKLQEIPGLSWIRIMYTHPAHVSDEIISAMTRNDKVLPYIDIPLQHISNRILSDMNRNISKDEIITVLKKLKLSMPEIAIRTTFIVGFPGETEEDFSELFDFIKDFKFQRLGVFQYSPEPATPAYLMNNQVNNKISEARFNKIMQLQQKITKNWANQLMGRELDVILNEKSANDIYPGYKYSGRSIHDAPDVDGLVVLKNIANCKPGDIVRVKINQNFIYDLGGNIINPR